MIFRTKLTNPRSRPPHPPQLVASYHQLRRTGHVSSGKLEQREGGCGGFSVESFLWFHA